MSKKLPYFQFEPAQYLSGDIQFCSLEAQGLFINICSLYWQRDCNLTKNQIVRKFISEDLIKELSDEGVIHFDVDLNLVISFLDEQYADITEDKSKRSISGIIGNLKRWHKDIYEQFKKGEINLDKALEIAKVSRTDSTATPTQSHLDKIRGDERKEDNIKDHSIIFFDSYLDNEQLVKSLKENLKLSDKEFTDYFNEFKINYLEALNEDEFNEAKKHFLNWMRKKIKEDKKGGRKLTKFEK